MPHYKCEVCRTRLYSAGTPAELVGDLCPDCGSLLEPVGKPSEVIGFQSITSRLGAPDSESPRVHDRIIERVDEFVARRAAILAQAQLDAGQWLDDGDSFPAQAVALARPETTS